VAKDFADGRPTYMQHLAQEYRAFFDHVCQEFPQVVYIMGNHEHYSGDVAKTYNILREHLDYGNLHILEKETWTHQGHTFVCGTLWTNMDNSDSLTLSYCKDAIVDHEKMLAYIDHATREPGSYIVVGHHCPSEQSVAECYKGNLLNGAFRSSLDDFIEARPQIRYWLHGHTHFNFNYWIGETRVVCNPRGYIGHEASADWFKLQYIEV
jgi:hypothetical protein